MFAFCVQTSGQTVSFKKLDRKSKNIFLFMSPNPEKLAHKLTDAYSTDEEKVRAIYIWITNNIKYDVKRFRRGSINQNSIETTLRKRKALCSEYSELFVALCNYSGIEAKGIKGFYKGTGTYENQNYYTSNHEWNIVKINGTWQLLDLTLASGHLIFTARFGDYAKWANLLPRVPIGHSKIKFKRKRNDFYYLSPPEKFVLTHLPSEKMYQLLTAPVPLNVFEQDTQHIQAFLKSQTGYFNFNQAIAAYQSLALPAQYLWEGDSAYSFNDKNSAERAVFYSMAALIKLNESGARHKRTKDAVIDTNEVHAADSLATISDSMIVLTRGKLQEEREEKFQRNNVRKQLAHDEIRYASKTINSTNAHFALTKDKYYYLKRHEVATQRALNEVLYYYRELDFPVKKLNLPSDTNTLNLVMDNNRKLIQGDLDSISARLSEINNLFKHLDSLWFDTITGWNVDFTRLNLKLFSITQDINGARCNYNNSLSPELAVMLYSRKMILDSMNLILSYKKNAEHVQKNMEHLMKENLKSIKYYTKTIRAKLIQNIKMGQPPGTTQAYTEALDKYEKALAVYSARFYHFRLFASGEIMWCKINTELNKRTGYALFCEGWYEGKRYHLYADLFNNHKRKIGHSLMMAQRYNRQTRRAAQQTMENEHRLQKLKAATK